EQSYNCQAAVDEGSQIIVATNVTQEANDKQQLKPLVEILTENLDGKKPKRMSADSGYFSEENVKFLNGERIDSYIATGRIKHSSKPQPVPRGRIPETAQPKNAWPANCERSKVVAFTKNANRSLSRSLGRSKRPADTAGFSCGG
ncbi:MAG: transposase, partial [Acidobacteria bacterium]|nr:transposase [Acidobacteriota bacterium]